MNHRDILIRMMTTNLEGVRRNLANEDRRFLAERYASGIFDLATFGELSGLLTRGESDEIAAGVGTIVYGDSYCEGYFGSTR